MQSFKKLSVLQRIQRVIEIAALVGMVLLAASHMFLSLLRYLVVPKGNIYNTGYRDVETRFWLGLLALAVVYAVLSLFSRATRQRLLTLLRRVFRKEMAFAVLFVAWIVISCISRKTVVGDASLQSAMNKWMLTDTGINLLILFPLPLLLGVKKGKAVITYLFHAVALFATAFAIICLISLFQLKSFALPSGNTVHVVRHAEFELGCNVNIVASIAFVMISISMYMIATQRLSLQIIYGIITVPHLIIMLHTNCRATQGALGILFFGIALMMTWAGTRRLPWAARLAVSLAAGVTAGIIAFTLQHPVHALFEAFTHFSGPQSAPAASAASAASATSAVSAAPVASTVSSPSSILYLSGREKIWQVAWQVITADFRTFMFGTTNARAIALLKDAVGSSFAHTHNQIIQIAMVMGVPAAEAFVVFLCWLGSKGLRMGLNLNGRQFRGAYAVPIILLAFLFVNLFEPYLVGYFSIMGCVFFLLSGLMVASHDKRDPTYRQMLRDRWARRHTAVEAKA